MTSTVVIERFSVYKIVPVNTFVQWYIHHIFAWNYFANRTPARDNAYGLWL